MGTVEDANFMLIPDAKSVLSDLIDSWGRVKTCEICGAHKSSLAGFLQMLQFAGEADSPAKPPARLPLRPQPTSRLRRPWMLAVWGRAQLWLSPSSLWPSSETLEGNERSVLDILSAVCGSLEGRNPVNVLSLPAPKEMALRPFPRHAPLFPRQTQASGWPWGSQGANGM